LSRLLVQYGPLGLGLAILAIGLVFGLTNWAWLLEGRPSESYPEIFYLGMVAPIGLALSVIGGLWARHVTRRKK
jgi:hypothetical protein